MSTRAEPAITRRGLLAGGVGLTTAIFLDGGIRAGVPAAKELTLVASSARWPLVDESGPLTNVWSYGDRIPGPELRLRQGEHVRITVRNDLPEETTVHWHGIRLPNAMDGVPGLTQPPIKPGETFTYEFTPPDAGTFWYHPHADSLRQLGRGMAGTLIVEESEPIAVDRELVWMLADWRLTRDAQIAPGFGNMMDAAMSGRIGNTVTVNGRISREIPVKAGERIRLRLINSSLARMMALRFDGHRPIVIALDGQPCEPHATDRLLIGPAMRTDLIIDMQGKPGRRYRIIDDFYSDLSYWLTELVYDRGPPSGSQQLDPPAALKRNPVPEPDLVSAERHELTLQGGMMSGGGMIGGGGGMMGMGGMRGDAAWAINGVSMTGDGHAGMVPHLTLKLGRSYLFTIRNDTAWWHPMHLHGHSFRLLRRNRSPVPHHQWADTVLIAPRETAEIAFVADNPGDWMLHCHVADHQVSGMMTVLRVA
jgi:FtsP/CotA-like multicopper oxidase with cupredoxin domain